LTRDIRDTRGDSCERAKHEAILYAAGELTESDAANYERHLRECAACHSTVAEYGAAVRVTASAPVGGPSLAALDRLSSAAREHIAHRTAPKHSATWLEQVREWLVSVRPAPALGWALAVLVLLFGIGRFVTDDGTIPTNGNVSAILAWEHEASEQAPVATATDVTDILPSYLTSDATEYTFAYDLVAIADELDALADKLQEF